MEDRKALITAILGRGTDGGAPQLCAALDALSAALAKLPRPAGADGKPKGGQEHAYARARGRDLVAADYLRDALSQAIDATAGAIRADLASVRTPEALAVRRACDAVLSAITGLGAPMEASAPAQPETAVTPAAGADLGAKPLRRAS